MKVHVKAKGWKIGKYHITIWKYTDGQKIFQINKNYKPNLPFK